MTCADCGLELTEDYGVPMLAYELKHIKATGRCVGCQYTRWTRRRIRELKGEVECQTKED